ncbi:MAG: adenylate/guanylate cyclase domain-containing protein [Acidimicrobiia bacterium]
MEELSLQAVAERTGASMGQLREWRAAALIPPGESLSLEDSERVRLICFLVQRGFSPRAIADAERNWPGLFDDFVAQLFPDGRFPTYSIGEAAARSGLDADLVQRVWEAAGLRELGYAADDEDVDALRALAIALGVGLPEGAVVEMVRVYADALRRVAEAEVRLVHFHLHERLRATGLSAEETKRVTDEASQRPLGLVEPAVVYFHRKGWSSALRDDLALHVAEEAGLSEIAGVPGTLSVAVVFTDLSRFTPLTEAMGDAVAAEIVERLSSIVRTVVGEWHGRIAKQIGDAYMLVFFEPRCAVACALEIERRAAAEPHFPAVRAGANWGPVLYREGDYGLS